MSWDDIAAKLDRVGDHLKRFREERDAFLNGDTNGVRNELDSANGYLSVIAFSNAAQPKLYSVLMGELLYHMRSTLDYTACLLTDPSGAIVKTSVEFPIYTRPDGASGFGVLGDSKAWNFKRIGQMDMAYQRIIEDEQPFKGKYGGIDDDPLTWLYHLSNIDRHQFLHVVTAAIRTSFTRVEPAEAEARLIQISSNFGPIEGEAEVARYMISSGDEIKVQVDSHAEFDIAFGDGGPLAGKFVSQTLADIGVRVTKIVQRLKL